MGTITKNSLIKEIEKIKQNSFWKEYFFYPLLFQEDFYGIAYNHFIDDAKYQKDKITIFNNEFNFLTLKRLMKESRESNYSWINSDQSFNKFQIVRELIIIIFNFIFTIESESFPKKMNQWNNSYESIHSIFPFMENKIQKSNICLDITIPYYFHSEILIRNFRQQISDTSFIHFLRLLFHQNEYISILNPKFYLRKNQFYNLLWNIQLYKFEYSLINIWKQIFYFQSTLVWFFIDQMSFVQKIRYVSEPTNFEPINTIIQKNYPINYARYQNSLIISTNRNLKFFRKKWNLFLLIFWEKYFHFWIESYRMDIKELSKEKSTLYFMGYLFRIKSKSTSMNIQLINTLFATKLITKEVCTIIPIVTLIKLLAKEKFCNISGRPICKDSWTTLTDFEIFRRFDQIIKNIFCYYSGCGKKKGLYQLQYILRFSCAKTLACKHKSTIRIVWKKYGSNFTVNSSFFKKTQLNLWRTYEKKIWYLNIIQINYLTNLSKKLVNIRNS